MFEVMIETSKYIYSMLVKEFVYDFGENDSKFIDFKMVLKNGLNKEIIVKKEDFITLQLEETKEGDKND